MTDGPNESVPPKNSLSSFVGLAFHPLVCLLGLCALRVGEGTVLQHLVHEAARVNCPPGSQVNSPIALSYLTPVSNSFLACFIVSLFRGRKVGYFQFPLVDRHNNNQRTRNRSQNLCQTQRDKLHQRKKKIMADLLAAARVALLCISALSFCFAYGKCHIVDFRSCNVRKNDH